jgi:hypothetical protein
LGARICLFKIISRPGENILVTAAEGTDCFDSGSFRVVWLTSEIINFKLQRNWLLPGGYFMSLIIYLIGFAFVIGGIAWALIVAKVSTLYVMIAVVILIGIAILTGVTRTRGRD